MRRGPEVLVNGVELLADLSGALYWPARRTLVVADLHLEKGSAFAVRGQLLPPYDSAATLQALAETIARYEPERVICLGDSFHDDGAAERLASADGAALRRLTAAHDWIWIAGNHDPVPPAAWGGRVETRVTLGALTFRHQAGGEHAPGEVSGHYHPRASVRTRARRITGRCFVSDGRRLVLPAFGAYTGGLDVLDPVIAGLFPRGFSVHLLGRESVYSFASTALADR
ncbi:MAG: ligase-associated DNA damage response endonuclease PdeM [Rhodospirillales bacterium]|nr:ligase-associated DNA damage response endonuclease PdeM [Rhodospirillales bacterium]MDH3790333.1 ligase-associated DNA damage response endonuclease PdeM [Rhodospirillales bacterium]MDH3912388.1 ligase-associated DNA damage response endonuclease PdeM [Rhodospirillales bacterium]MDH3917971.1 ligase-associated DNA damage response endonuclease PdeM [Rhodospirillales bacterium]MDH3967687.1 ligase-associated DNA damage response endonuclease PdeM [Rhodospirillales bacterium]